MTPKTLKNLLNEEFEVWLVELGKFWERLVGGKLVELETFCVHKEH